MQFNNILHLNNDTKNEQTEQQQQRNRIEKIKLNIRCIRVRVFII